MNGHTWICVLTILGYLYYLSRIIDRNRHILIKKSRIQEPAKEDGREMDQWRHDMKQISREIRAFRRQSLLLFLIIPIVEIGAHFILGEYLINDLLLSLLFFGLFLLSLLVVIFAMKGKSREFKKPYTRPG